MDEQEIMKRIEKLELMSRLLEDIQAKVSLLASHPVPEKPDVPSKPVKITLASHQCDFLDRLRDQVYQNSGRRPQRGKILGILLDTVCRAGLDLSDASNLEEIASAISRICDLSCGNRALFDNLGSG